MIVAAWADIDLPATMQTGLDNGVPLTFIMDVRFLRQRTWWFDQAVASFERHYRLTYYELTRHYRVHALQSNTRQNYRSLTSALTGLGRFDNVRFELSTDDQQQLSKDSGLLGSLHLRLDTTALPLPLQPLIRSSWKLASEDYRWPVI